MNQQEAFVTLIEAVADHPDPRVQQAARKAAARVEVLAERVKKFRTKFPTFDGDPNRIDLAPGGASRLLTKGEVPARPTFQQLTAANLARARAKHADCKTYHHG